MSHSYFSIHNQPTMPSCNQVYPWVLWPCHTQPSEHYPTSTFVIFCNQGCTFENLKPFSNAENPPTIQLWKNRVYTKCTIVHLLFLRAWLQLFVGEEGSVVIYFFRFNLLLQICHNFYQDGSDLTQLIEPLSSLSSTCGPKHLWGILVQTVETQFVIRKGPNCLVTKDLCQKCKLVNETIKRNSNKPVRLSG